MANKGFYQITGLSNNTKINAAIGSIIRISAEDVNAFNTESEHPYFRTYVARVKIQIPERSNPDGIAVLERLSIMTAPRKRAKKELPLVWHEEDVEDTIEEIEKLNKSELTEDVSTSIKAGKMPKKIYDEYAKPGEPLPKKFYVRYAEGDGFAQTHIRGILPDDVEKWNKKEITLAELLSNHSIHLDLSCY